MRQPITHFSPSEGTEGEQPPSNGCRTFPRLDELPAFWLVRQEWRRKAANILIPTYLALIYGLPALCVLAAVHARGLIAFCLVAITPLVFLATAIALSLPHQSRVVEGRMPVDTAVPAYFHRRLYRPLLDDCLLLGSDLLPGPVDPVAASRTVLRIRLSRFHGFHGLSRHVDP